MTTKEKLDYIREAEEFNEQSIERFVTLKKLLSREPMRKRTDPRYILKQNVKWYTKAAIKATPETVACIIGGMAIIFLPAFFMLVMGAR